MKLISVNIGLPREAIWQGRTVTTGIFKTPVSGPVMLRRFNLDGDRQADLTVHGGKHKAVYAYPAEHYDYWHGELPELDLPWGAFGENFTTEGLSEDTVNIGDRFRIGSAEVRVAQPRLPCYKLCVRFGRDDMVKRFMASRRTGIYFAVLKEGEVEAGDAIEMLHRDENNVTVADIARMHIFDKDDAAGMRRALQIETLPAGWVDYFQSRLEK
ncbi:MAG: MOSC domain-containing protein [Acidobacteriota bacterium]|jgi:MOSC domain-containing protein YiiM